MKNVEKMEELLNLEMLLNPDFILEHASIRLVPSSKRPKEGDLFKDFGPNMLLKAGLAVDVTGGVLWRAMNNEMMRCLPGEPEEKRRSFNEAAVNNLRKEAVVFPMGSDPFEMIAGINDHTQRIEFGNDCYPVIVTNRSGIYGAATVLAIAEQAAEQMGGAFYMLPSSVHEVILLPESMGISYEEAALLVQEVNSSEVGPEDFLSDTVYRYENDRFFIPRHKAQA